MIVRLNILILDSRFITRGSLFTIIALFSIIPLVCSSSFRISTFRWWFDAIISIFIVHNSSLVGLVIIMIYCLVLCAMTLLFIRRFIVIVRVRKFWFDNRIISLTFFIRFILIMIWCCLVNDFSLFRGIIFGIFCCLAQKGIFLIRVRY